MKLLENAHKDILKAQGYEVQATLGKGGEAVVYQAYQAGCGLCAVKAHKETDNPNELERHVQKGLAVAAEMRNSNYYVKLFTWFIQQGVLFTVWELSKNGTLRDLLRKRLSNGQGPLSREECCHLLQDVAKGLDELHSCPGVHGDIKPENLLIFNDGSVKIGDLGISRLITSLTTGDTTVLGSPLYFLPMCHAVKMTKERDLFAFAATYVELRLGRYAYGPSVDIARHNLETNNPQLEGLDKDELKLVKQLLLQDDPKQAGTNTTVTAWLERIKPQERFVPPPTPTVTPAAPQENKPVVSIDKKPRFPFSSKQGLVIRTVSFKYGSFSDQVPLPKICQMSQELQRLFPDTFEAIPNNWQHHIPPYLKEQLHASGYGKKSGTSKKTAWNDAANQLSNSLRSSGIEAQLPATLLEARLQSNAKAANESQVPEKPKPSFTSQDQIQIPKWLEQFPHGCGAEPPYGTAKETFDDQLQDVHDVALGGQKLSPTVATTSLPIAKVEKPKRDVNSPSLPTTSAVTTSTATIPPGKEGTTRGVSIPNANAITEQTPPKTKVIAPTAAQNKSASSTKPKKVSRYALRFVLPIIGIFALFEAIASLLIWGGIWLVIQSTVAQIGLGVGVILAGVKLNVVFLRDWEMFDGLIETWERWAFIASYMFVVLIIPGYMFLKRNPPDAAKVTPIAPGTKAGERRVVTIEGIDFAFRWCPPTTSFPGKFRMGTPTSESGHFSDETQVDVILDIGYWMLETEVTQAMYFAVVKARPWQGKEWVNEGANYPAVYMTWQDASDFCDKLTGAARQSGVLSANAKIALPTEAQWEWAARAGTTTAYFFGDDVATLGDFAWYYENAWNIGEKYAHQVGLKNPNQWGLLDMTGNVWELCSDEFHSTLSGGTNPIGSEAPSYPVFQGKRFVMEGTASRNSIIGSDVTPRVVRGASFTNDKTGSRVGHRGYHPPNIVRTIGDYEIGFRVVVSVE